jgi:hypothetical protein
MQEVGIFRKPPFQKHSPTSREAAGAIDSEASRLRRKVLEFLGGGGATDEEIQEGTGMLANTERPRRRELQLAKKVRDSGRKRQTKSGRNAVIWVLM